MEPFTQVALAQQGQVAVVVLQVAVVQALLAMAQTVQLAALEVTVVLAVAVQEQVE
jgi:hypothetical protein